MDNISKQWYGRDNKNEESTSSSFSVIDMTKAQFIWSAKVSNAYFSVAILTYAPLISALHMLTLVLMLK